MAYSIEKIIKTYYGLSARLISQGDNQYIFLNKNMYYCLQIIDEKNIDTLNISSPYLIEVIPTRFKTSYIKYGDQFYFLTQYNKTSSTIANAVTTLSELHQSTYYIQRVSNDFYDFELNYLKERIKNIFSYYENIIDDLLNQTIYHPGLWLLLELYPMIQWAKEMAMNSYEKYKQLVENKETCRFCLSLNQKDLTSYSSEINAFTSRELINYDMVGKDFISLCQLDIEYENIDSFYMFSFEEVEKYWIAVSLLCLPIISFYHDGYQEVYHLFYLKRYLLKLNKILNSLQIENFILYNEDR